MTDQVDLEEYLAWLDEQADRHAYETSHDEPMHICKCGELFPSARFALGYRSCLDCGDTAARQVRHCVVPMNKSNYTVITNRAELAWLNPKRTA
jgi:hypothetical protein